MSYYWWYKIKVDRATNEKPTSQKDQMGKTLIKAKSAIREYSKNIAL